MGGFPGRLDIDRHRSSGGRHLQNHGPRQPSLFGHHGQARLAADILSDAALSIAGALVCGFEGFREKPYQDGSGIWTQGYGCTHHTDGRKVDRNDQPVSEPDARRWMELLLIPTLVRVRDLVKSPISNNAAAALASFAYNVGVPAFASSSLLMLVNRREFLLASKEFPRWVHDRLGNEEPGLVTRRAKEAAVFLTPDPATPAPIPVSV